METNWLFWKEIIPDWMGGRTRFLIGGKLQKVLKRNGDEETKKEACKLIREIRKELLNERFVGRLYRCGEPVSHLKISL